MSSNEESRISRVIKDVIIAAGLALMAYVASRSTRNKPAPERDFMKDR